LVINKENKMGVSVKTVAVEEKREISFQCDLCRDIVNEDGIAASTIDLDKLKKMENYTCDSTGSVLCNSCAKIFPEDVINALGTIGETPKGNNAWSLVFTYEAAQVRNEFEDDEVNLHKGSWAFFSDNDEGESSSLVDVTNGDIGRAVEDKEFFYRGFPMHLQALLIDGKLKTFRVIRTVEVGDYGENGDIPSESY
jgi:hypothetical protein